MLQHLLYPYSYYMVHAHISLTPPHPPPHEHESLCHYYYYDDDDFHVLIAKPATIVGSCYDAMMRRVLALWKQSWSLNPFLCIVVNRIKKQRRRSILGRDNDLQREASKRLVNSSRPSNKLYEFVCKVSVSIVRSTRRFWQQFFFKVSSESICRLNAVKKSRLKVNLSRPEKIVLLERLHMY